MSGDGYGGYLAMAALANFGERLRGGVDFAGITDFIRHAGQSSPASAGDRRAEFGDDHDPDVRAYLRRISPLTNADRIDRPLLIVHGLHDSEVPVADSQELINQLRRHGSQVWYLQANDEGHEFRRKADRDAYYAAFAEFLATMK
jgi:dipeptidyl aminopeptidase/acylaminoacyl peptidase